MITDIRHTFDSMPEAYASMLLQILEQGHQVNPRGMNTKELIGASFTLREPMYNVVTQAERRISLPFMAAEFLWMITGSNDARLIKPYNRNIGQFSDDGLFFRGAYGPKLVDQLPYITETLSRDPSSRQALLTIWRERPGPSKDIPCTVLMQFFIRTGLLDMLVYMRSNDAWLGLPYDVFNFTMIQQYVASLLDVDVGFYHHHVGSLHLYEQHWERAKAVIAEGLAAPIVQSDPLMAPLPPEAWTVFTGMSLLGQKQGVTPKDVTDWLDLSGTARYLEWMDLLRLCAYKFHGQVNLLPAQYERLVMYWDDHTDKQREDDVTALAD